MAVMCRVCADLLVLCRGTDWNVFRCCKATDCPEQQNIADKLVLRDDVDAEWAVKLVWCQNSPYTLK